MRVVMIHALAESIPPVRLAFQDEFPEAEVINLLDEGLLIDFPGSITPNLAAAYERPYLLLPRPRCGRYWPGLFSIRPGRGLCVRPG